MATRLNTQGVYLFFFVVENVAESTLSEKKEVEETGDEGETAEDKRPSRNDDEKDVKKLLDIAGRFFLNVFLETTSPGGRR